MTNNQDSRPFVDLKKDAEEFRMKFDDDIEECLNFLDAKITTLICEPDTFGTLGRSLHQNALAEFSKAKYDIFISVKSLINAKEREWLDYISEMKKLFIENVEIFLAGTKLEVKLPSSESASSHGSRKSPGNRKSNSASVTSSIYPILSSIAKNIPVLGSSHQEKVPSRTVSNINVGDNTQFNGGGRPSTSSIELASSLYDEEEMDIEEHILSFNRSRTSLERRSSLKREIDLGLHEENASILESNLYMDMSESVNANNLPSKVCGRRGKAAKQNSTIDMNTNDLPKVRGRRGKLNDSSEKSDVAQSSNNSTDESEDQTVEVIQNDVPLKGRRGRSVPKTKANDIKVVAQNSSSTDDSEGQTTEMTQKEIPLKGRRGRAASKAKTIDLIVVHENGTDEIEDQATETIEKEIPLKGRKGRAAVKSKNDDLSGKSIPQKTFTRGRKAVKSAIEETYVPGPSTSKEVPFYDDNSSSDELDIQTPLARSTKPIARRKTLLPNLEDVSVPHTVLGNSSRSKVKRKTISGVSDLGAVAPSKRLKVSQKTISSQDEDSANDNLLESDGNYSDWMSLKTVDGKIPIKPAVYEVKVWRAKKSAYIGSCDNLRQKLTLYNLKQNSGHKHLDKFIDRNYNEIQVRYEIVSSFDNAKKEVKSRVENFKAQHKNPPAYN